jgi:hypothetical protein
MMPGNDNDAGTQTARYRGATVGHSGSDTVREQQPAGSLCPLREVDDGPQAGILVRIVAANGK